MRRSSIVTAIAFMACASAVPLISHAQSRPSSCGAETWSAADMRYKNVPCTAGQPGQAQAVKSETHAAQPAPIAAANDTCNPRVAAIKDE
jgi:hypothetical protein